MTPPRFDQDVKSDDLVVRKVGHFGFSAAKIEDLGATEYTLVTIVLDDSGSTYGFSKEMEAALKEIIGACQSSPRADNLMVRLVVFASTKNEVHGFKLLSTISANDYDDLLQAKGMTTLYDSAIDGVEATAHYGRELLEQDYDANGIVFFITDGMDTGSTFTPKEVAAAIANCTKKECLESITTILIAIADPQNPDPSVMTGLEDFKNDANIDQFVKLSDASKKTLAKLASFVSASISSTSQALGTGAPSQSIVF